MKLITLNSSRKKKFLYGKKFDDLAIKPVFSNSEEKIELNHPKRKIKKIELAKTPDKTHDMLVFTRIVGGEEVVEIKELESIRNDREFESDAKIMASYELVSNKKDIKRINSYKFLEDIKGKFANDVRTAFKVINTSSSKKVSYSVYIYHVYALITGTMSIINKLDFKPPVLIELKTTKEGMKLSLEIKSNMLAGLRGRQKLIGIPGIETRLEYLGLLCQEDDINSTFEITSKTLNIEYNIVEAPYKEGVLLADTREECRFFEELMDIFSYTRVDQEEEE